MPSAYPRTPYAITINGVPVKVSMKHADPQEVERLFEQTVKEHPDALVIWKAIYREGTCLVKAAGPGSFQPSALPGACAE